MVQEKETVVELNRLLASDLRQAQRMLEKSSVRVPQHASAGVATDGTESTCLCRKPTLKAVGLSQWLSNPMYRLSEN